MHINRPFFLQNPKLGMLVRAFDKMPEVKRRIHLNTAKECLKSISNKILI